MTDKDLEDMYRASVDESHVTALRMIYDLGVAAGAGATLTDLSTSASRSAARPADAVVAQTKKVTKRK